LDGIHNVGLLSEKYVAEVSGPLDVVGEALDYVGEAARARMLGSQDCLAMASARALSFRVGLFFSH
jgi:hypothetical protein